MWINNKFPFLLYCNCEVEYSGRACSILENGNYLILYKNDKSLVIHGGDKITPRNYQGKNSNLLVEGDYLISTNKSETIKIKVIHVLNYFRLANWSNNDTIMTKTEKELVNKIYENWYCYVGVKCEEVYKEYMTEHGPVDLLGINNNKYHIIEVKRRKCNLKDATQLRKYLECFENKLGYLAGPDISEKALKYLDKHGCKFISVDF